MPAAMMRMPPENSIMTLIFFIFEICVCNIRENGITSRYRLVRRSDDREMKMLTRFTAGWQMSVRNQSQPLSFFLVQYMELTSRVGIDLPEFVKRHTAEENGGDACDVGDDNEGISQPYAGLVTCKSGLPGFYLLASLSSSGRFISRTVRRL
jgi:hypothetical protein